MINIKKLTKYFGKLQVLNQLDLTIDQGGIFVILGPNGSGKTTLIKSILGMVIPNEGTITINNQVTKNNFEYRKNISYLPQIANFPGNITVQELISLMKDLRESDAHEKDLIAKFQLGPFLNKKLNALSGGTKQKVNIVLTFMFDTDIIILDEPTTGLDPISLIALKELIAEKKSMGKTILITTHIMSFVKEIADEIVFLLDGKIYFKGTISELQKQTNQTDLEHAIAHVISPDHV